MLPGSLDVTSFNHQHALAAKAFIALAATVLLGWWWYADHHRIQTGRRARDAALALLGILSFLAWFNFGAFAFGAGRFHYYEFFHYYVGAKYSPELGYTGLYDCVALADAERGRRAEVENRWVRDLGTLELRRGSPAVADPSLCRDRFASRERWEAFAHDVEWFRARIGTAKWLEAQMDHGYNASPVWTFTGRALANTGPASERQMALLWWIDPLLIAAMAGTVWWGFGWRVLCVALTWWGTNYAARYMYIGGAFLRHDWLFLAIAAICLARRGRPAASGAALTWSALLRVFPAFIAVGLVLNIATAMIVRRRLSLEPAQRRFAWGAAMALVVWLPLSLTVGGGDDGGLSTWTAFVHNTGKLASSPSLNRVGLPVVMAFDPANRAERVSGYWINFPWDVWEEGRRRTLSERRLVQGLLMAAYLGLLALAVRGRDDWIALTLGIGAIPFLVEISNYYYGILLGLAFLWPVYRVAGFGLALTALLSNLLLVPLPGIDDRATAISAMILLLVVVISVATAARLPHKTLALEIT